MSQHTVYKDDFDGKEIGAKTHITLMLSTGTGSGIAVPPAKAGPPWHTVRIPSNFLHFRSEETMAKYFKKLIEKAK